MSIAQLFLKKKPTFWPGGLSILAPLPIEFDATVRESHDTRFQWSGSPIENGQFATDHGQELPPMVLLELVATAHPDTLIPNLQATRHIRLYNRLLQLARRKEPFDLVTGVKIYTSMVFDRIGLPRTKGTTFAFSIPAAMHKVEIATIDIAQNLADAAAEITLGEQDVGAAATAAESAVPA